MFRLLILISFTVFGIQGFKLPEVNPLSNYFDLVTPLEYAKQFGYPGEAHTVTTEDGYILTMHRIPYGRNGTKPNKIPVFVMHGLLGNSACFADVSAERSLAYVLADAGYDVWLGNTRGNSYGLNHTTIDPFKNPRDFYNYSWHEIGYYDLPASIDYILELTGEKSLHYIGHSQGGTVFPVLTSTRPEYNDKIRLASLMAPAIFMQNTPSLLIKIASALLDPIITLVEDLQIFFVPTELFRIPAKILCQNDTFEDICAFFYNFGYPDWEEFDPIWFPSVLDNNPSPGATKQLYHYGQVVRSGGFPMYDYGEHNQEVYGQPTPPQYNLSAISAPVALYYGSNDMGIGIPDIDLFAETIPNLAGKYLIPWKNFTHLDHLFAKDVVKLEYQPMIDLMKQY